jgi:translation initiation factor IF-3
MAALALAQEVELDLVLVSPSATPPVAKILDYGKYKFEMDQKAKESRRHQGGSGLKEMRFRLKIDKNDFDFKVAAVSKFLQGGDKVKVQIMFRGREMQHPELGVDLLYKVADAVAEFGTIMNRPTQEGRNATMVLQPIAKKEHTVSEQRRRGGEVKSARAERQAKRLAAKGIDANGNKVVEKPADKKPAADKPAKAAKEEVTETDKKGKKDA